MATIVVFENGTERAMMSADTCHAWSKQKLIFGKETEKLLDYCDRLFHAELHFQKEEAKYLKKKIYGIAKNHGLRITWYGEGHGPCEPDRFIVSGKGHTRLAMIQC